MARHERISAAVLDYMTTTWHNHAYLRHWNRCVCCVLDIHDPSQSSRKCRNTLISTFTFKIISGAYSRLPYCRVLWRLSSNPILYALLSHASLGTYAPSIISSACPSAKFSARDICVWFLVYYKVGFGTTVFSMRFVSNPVALNFCWNCTTQLYIVLILYFY